MKTVLTGGEPLTRQSILCLGSICKYVIITYASSELTLVSAHILSDPVKLLQQSCGQIFRNREVKLVDRKGNTVQVGESGEIYVRGNNVFAGYHNEPDKTKAVVTEDGWFKTEDAGRFQEDGLLIVEGRIVNQINVDGINISPESMEGFMVSFPGVESVIIVPVPDAVTKQMLCACVKAKPGSDVSEADLRKLCEDLHNAHRSFAAVPKYFLLLDDFPKTSTGKVSRKAVEAIARDTFSK